MMRVSVFRLSPLLLLAAALVALAVLFAPGGQPAQAQTTTVWSATLTAQRISLSNGCSNFGGIASAYCSLTSVLTDNDFTYNGVNYEIQQVILGDNGNLNVILDKAIPSGLSLNVDGTEFSVASGILSNSDKTVEWSTSGLNWSAGDTVSLSLTGSSPTAPTAPTLPPGTTENWSDTLAVKAVDYGFGCGYRTGQPPCSAALTDVNGFVLPRRVLPCPSWCTSPTEIPSSSSWTAEPSGQ